MTENTKTDGISSGFVAFCYMSEQYEIALFDGPPTDPLYADMFPVVRLSDAEAIIAEKDAEIKALKHRPANELCEMLRSMQEGEMTVSRGIELVEMWLAGNYSDDQLPPVNNDLTEDQWPMEELRKARSEIKKQVERSKELMDDLEESDAIRDRCAHLLAETAVALKGPEKALHRHGWQDLPQVAAKQSAALKLARELLPSRIPNGFVSFGKFFAEQEDLFADPYNKMSKFKRDYLTRCEEALAAIDALGEVK